MKVVIYMNRFFPKVFLWMFIGLLVTFITGVFVLANPNMLYNIFSNGMYMFVWLAELVVVAVLSVRIHKMNPLTAKIMFLLYSILTGVSLSIVGVVFELSSIMWIFCLTAGIFAIFGLLGMYTKIDLTKLGTYLLMGLLGLILATVINLFVGNGIADIMIWSLGILIFVGFTAYDMQRIKRMSENGLTSDNMAILGALELYLDFINIFLRLLNLFGKSKN